MKKFRNQKLVKFLHLVTKLINHSKKIFSRLIIFPAYLCISKWNAFNKRGNVNTLLPNSITQNIKEINVDSYVESFKKIHFLVIILTTLTCIFASTIYSENKLLRKLKVLDMVFVLDNISQNDNFKKFPHIDPLTLADISEYYYARGIFSDLRLETFSKAMPDIKRNKTSFSYYLESEKNEKEKLKIVELETYMRQGYLNKRLISNTYRSYDNFFFSNPSSSCVTGIYGGLADQDVILSDQPASLDLIKSNTKNIYLINIAGVCLNKINEINTALLLKVQDKFSCKKNCKFHWMIALSKEDAHQLVNFGNFKSFDLNLEEINFFENYSDIEKKLIKHQEYYIPLKFDDLEKKVFDLARIKTNRIYRPDEMKEALNDLLVEKDKKEGDFLGIKFDANLFLNFAPFLMYVLLYEMYRRVLIIYKYKNCITVPWIFVEISSIVDFVISIILSFTPAVSFLVVNFLFIDSQNMYFDVFGYQVSPRNILNMSFPKSLNSAWVETNYLYGILETLSPVLLYFIYKLQRDLLRILFSANKSWKQSFF